MAKRNPRTVGFEAPVALNAVQHGPRSGGSAATDIGRRDFDAVLDGLVQDLQPKSELEHHLVELAAVSLWRLRRIHRDELQSGSVASQHREGDLDSRHAAGITPASIHQAETKLQLFEDACSLLERLPAMQDDEQLPGEVVSEIIRWFAVNDDELLAFSLPGLPSVLVHNGFRGWTAGLLRVAASEIARRLDETLDELLDETIVCLRDDVDARRRNVEEMEGERARPLLAELESRSRCEAQIHTQFYSALHELEAVQSRRGSNVQPLRGRAGASGPRRVKVPNEFPARI